MQLDQNVYKTNRDTDETPKNEKEYISHFIFYLLLIIHFTQKTVCTHGRRVFSVFSEAVSVTDLKTYFVIKVHDHCEDEVRSPQNLTINE